jgi:hypothetical protein
MAGLEVLLRDRLDRHEAHRGPGDRFPKRFGIGHIMRVRLDIGFDKLGCHQLHTVPVFAEAPRPIMGTPTGFHPDYDWGPLSHK